MGALAGSTAEGGKPARERALPSRLPLLLPTSEAICSVKKRQGKVREPCVGCSSLPAHNQLRVDGPPASRPTVTSTLVLLSSVFAVVITICLEALGWGAVVRGG